MNAIGTVMRKELRGFFQSSVALLFLGVFLIVTLFSFFTGARFFARNIADVRPLFEWLPLLLIFLVSAVTMRAWAEERRSGTLELLLTLPLGTRDLVLGKFFAAVVLVAVALAMTLPLPIMVGQMGDLDWGPVVGGYVGALMLGAAYVAIGLCVSARTDNQVVALMTTLAVGGAVYLLGSDAVVDLVGAGLAEVLRNVGTGARFESIERGVFDLRDFVYYASIAVFALVQNRAFLEEDRVDADSPIGRRAWWSQQSLVGLVALNVVLANVWLAPVTGARVDLTQGGEYSISRVTRTALAELDEPLVIEGYFSERTHPLLAPLVPQILDLVAEYEIAGRGNVRLALADPNTDEELQQRIQEDFGVRSTPFRVADRTQQAVVNAYFHLVIRYADQYEVLGFDELIEVRVDGEDVEVRLRNLEYDLTRSIRRVSQNFQTVDTLLASLPAPAQLTAYVSPDTLPEEFGEVVDRVRTVGEDLAARSDRLTFHEVDPSSDPALRERILQRYNVRPMPVDFFGTEHFYLDIVLESGDRVERIVPQGDPSEAEIRQGLESAIRRNVPGQLTTIGILTHEPDPPEMDPNIPPQFQPPPEQPDFRILEQLLAESYEVRRLNVDDGIVPADIDALIVGKAGDMSEEQLYAIDQYLMRGGSVVALAGRTDVSATRQGLEAKRTSTGLEGLLETYGIRVGSGMVLDPQNATFPIPVQERRGNLVLERIELMDYPFFPDVRSDGFDSSHPALSGLAGVTLPWSSPLDVTVSDEVEITELLRTTDGSWVQSGTDIEPDFEAHPETGFGSGEADAGQEIVAVAATGTFTSHYADRPSPIWDPGEVEGSGADASGRSLTRSLPGGRLVVVGSGELVSDLILSLAQQPGGEPHRANLEFVQNLVDWSVEDTDLLQIRSAGAFARTLRPMDDSTTRAWELGQYGFALVLLGVLAAVPWYRRRSVVPISKEG